MLESLRTLLNCGSRRAFGRGDLILHVTGYPSRSRDRLCDRHTATATRSPPHGHRHTVTATRPSHPWPGYVPGHVPGHVISHVPGYVISYVPGHVISYVPGHVISYVLGCDGTFDHGNLPGPLALGHSRRPLALWHPWPLLPFGPWPLLPRGQHPSSTLANGGLRLSAALGACGALGPWRPPTYGGLWPMGHPWPR